MAGILSTARLGFPFETDSPFLFAVYHLDKYPPGNAELGVDAHLLRGHRIGADFGNPVGWNMYHGSEGVPGFPKHPHRGFETVTIVYQGEVSHRDSTGKGGTIYPGDVQWMTAGSGILHDEFHSEAFTERGGTMEMAQLWVNLPKEHKMAQPGYQAIKSDDIPNLTLEGGSLRVIAGEYQGKQGPAHTYSPVNVWDLSMQSGQSQRVDINEQWNAIVVVLKGAISLK